MDDRWVWSVNKTLIFFARVFSTVVTADWTYNRCGADHKLEKLHFFSSSAFNSGLWCCLRKGSCKCSGSLRWPGWQGPITEFASFATFFVFGPTTDFASSSVFQIQGIFSPSVQHSQHLTQRLVLQRVPQVDIRTLLSLFWSHRFTLCHLFVLCQRRQFFFNFSLYPRQKNMSDIPPSLQWCMQWADVTTSLTRQCKKEWLLSGGSNFYLDAKRALLCRRLLQIHSDPRSQGLSCRRGKSPSSIGFSSDLQGQKGTVSRSTTRY